MFYTAVIPFFEMLRREHEAARSGLRLGVLCGTIVVIPAEAKEALLKEIEGVGQVTFHPIGLICDTDYVKVDAVGNSHFLTGAVTNLFTNGYMQVLIGTKSLLGEGWDSPCINSLILASFVGSFMLSNQMRGRAIRVFKQNPDKCSNIWHLVCVNPQKKAQQSQRSEDISEDYALLERRMENFLGLHYTENIIESGISRLSIIKPPFDEDNVKVMNQQMLELSGHRDTLKERWQNALVLNKFMEVVEEAEVKTEAIPSAVFRDVVRESILFGAVALGAVVLSLLEMGGDFGSFSLGVMALACGMKVLTAFPSLLFQSTPLKRLRLFGKGILCAMNEKRLLEEPRAYVKTEKLSNGDQSIYLVSSSGKDKQMFAQCINQMMGEVDNQRYLLVNRTNRNGLDGFYCVPDCFAANREDAELFARCIRSVVKKYDLVYTRNEAGRKILLEGRKKAWANRQARCTSRKKVKGALE